MRTIRSSGKCQLNQKNKIHDRDSIPDLVLEKLFLNKKDLFLIKKSWQIGLKKKEKRPYWINTFSYIFENVLEIFIAWRKTEIHLPGVTTSPINPYKKTKTIGSNWETKTSKNPSSVSAALILMCFVLTLSIDLHSAVFG